MTQRDDAMRPRGPRGYVPGPITGTTPDTEVPLNGRSALSPPTRSRDGLDRPTTHRARGRRGPGPAQRELMAAITADRRARQQRALAVILGAISLLVLTGAGAARLFLRQTPPRPNRVRAGTTGTPASGPITVLIASEVDHDGRRSALALVRIYRSRATIVAIPGDSWVSVPGHGTSDIETASRIGGPSLLTKTVARATNLTINDYEVNSLALVSGVRSGAACRPARPRSLRKLLHPAAADVGLNFRILARAIGRVRYVTVTGVATTPYVTPAGASALRWNDAVLFRELRQDRYPPAAPRSIPRSQIALDVYNGTEITGLSLLTGQRLLKLGFAVRNYALNWPDQHVAQTVILYPQGQRAAAEQVHQALPGALTRRGTGPHRRITIVLGAAGHKVDARQTPGHHRSKGRCR